MRYRSNNYEIRPPYCFVFDECHVYLYVLSSTILSVSKDESVFTIYIYFCVSKISDEVYDV